MSAWPFEYDLLIFLGLPVRAVREKSSVSDKTQRRKIDPKKSTQNKKVHLNKFFRTTFVGVLARVTENKGKVRASFSKKFAWTRYFFGISGFWVGFGPLKTRPRKNKIGQDTPAPFLNIARNSLPFWLSFPIQGSLVRVETLLNVNFSLWIPTDMPDPYMPGCQWGSKSFSPHRWGCTKTRPFVGVPCTFHSLRIYPYSMVWPLPRRWSKTMVSIPFWGQKALEIKCFLGLERPFLDLVSQTPRPRGRGRPLFGQLCRKKIKKRILDHLPCFAKLPVRVKITTGSLVIPVT